MEKTTEPSALQVFTKTLLCGGTGGAASKTLTAPLERTKLLLQTQNIRTGDQYKGVFDTLRQVTKKQGILSFWRGNGVNCMPIIPNAGLRWAVFGRLKDFTMPLGKENYSGWDLLGRSFVAGGGAGGVALLATYPIDLARTRLAADMARKGQERLYTGFISCIHTVWRREGFRSVYSGLHASLSGYIPYLAIKFSAMEMLLRWTGENSGSKLFPVQMMLIGGAVGTLSKCATYPLDTIRVQMQVTGRQLGMFQCMKRIYAKDGFRGFYKGLMVNIPRGMLGTSIEFCVVGIMKSLLHDVI